MTATTNLAHCISCRITDGQFEALRALCAQQRLTPSRYLRAVIALLLTQGTDADAVLLDSRLAWELERELRRQGHNLNQGVHALNGIAQFAREGKRDIEWLENRFEATKLAFGSVIDHHNELVRLMREIKSKTIIGGD